MLDLGELILHIKADSSSAQQEINTIKNEWTDAGSTITSVGKSVTGVGKSLSVVSTVVAGVGTKAVSSFAEVDKTM
jgi:hypothetical protein